MAHVVAEPCIGCKYTDCVVVCPAVCFHEGPQMLYIHPDDCIDCEACVPECPKDAIFHQDHLPEEWIPFKDLNATMARQCVRVSNRRERLQSFGIAQK
jgi:ferredoxin